MNLEPENLENLLITIPSGQVEMRDDRIKKLWEVEIKSFKIAKYPVTQALYKSIMKNNPSVFRGDNLPIETVSWFESISFCNKLSEANNKTKCYSIDSKSKDVIFNPASNGFRLPTEAEWQYACQSGTKSIDSETLKKMAWFKDNSENRSQDVGLKQPNDWGIFDMLGNVWEWCSDIYDETVYGSYRVFRGGGWCDIERSVMPTTRRRSHPYAFKIDDLGFRIAINIEL